MFTTPGPNVLNVQRRPPQSPRHHFQMHIKDAHAVDARLEVMREFRGLSSAVPG